MLHQPLPRDPIDHVGEQATLRHPRPEGAHDQQWQIGGRRQAADQTQAFGVRPMQVFGDEHSRATVEEVAHKIDGRAQALLAADGDVSAGVAAQGRDDRPEQDPQRFP